MSVFFCVSYARLGFCETAANAKINKALEINRSMVARFEAQQLELRKKRAENPSVISDTELENLNYKIKALREDATRLRGLPPKDTQTGEIAKDWSLKKLVSAPGGGAPDHEIIEMHERALKYVAANEFGKALALYQEIVLKNPEDDQAYIIMGHIYLMSGQYEKSESAFENAAHIDPENIHEIAPFYENKILQNPDDDTAYADLGCAYLMLGENLKAGNAFKNALSINPNNRTALKGLNWIAVKQN